MTDSQQHPQFGSNKGRFKQQGSFALFGNLAVPRVSQVFRILGDAGGTMAKTALEAKADPAALAKGVENKYINESPTNYQLTTEGVNFYNSILEAEAEESSTPSYLAPSAAAPVGNFD